MDRLGPCIPQRHAGVTMAMGVMRCVETGLRFDIVVDLPRGNGDQWILQLQAGILRLPRLPDVVQTLAANAAGEVGMELSRGISSDANASLSSLGALTLVQEAGAVPRFLAAVWQSQRRREGVQTWRVTGARRYWWRLASFLEAIVE